ncbi:hypothetical protein Taro_027700 [Colocasia esculenta]|uniref:RNA helicase n=1 Tax=Colocasia esculenta TaxID=4460 RepID=A0A843VGD9_COLES|nr:hypothetical protein [Colocasia esculenta]
MTMTTLPRMMGRCSPHCKKFRICLIARQNQYFQTTKGLRLPVKTALVGRKFFIVPISSFDFSMRMFTPPHSDSGPTSLDSTCPMEGTISGEQEIIPPDHLGGELTGVTEHGPPVINALSQGREIAKGAIIGEDSDGPGPAPAPAPAAAAMSSVAGVFSLYKTAPADRPSLKAAAFASAQVLSSFPRCFLKGASRGRALVVSAVASPNSLLGEEAIKGLGWRSFTESSLEQDGLEEEHDGGDDELAIANLGLPQQLVDCLEKRGITHLFPIQEGTRHQAVRGPWCSSGDIGTVIAAANAMLLFPSKALAQMCDATLSQQAASMAEEGSNATCHLFHRLVLMDLDPATAKLAISIIGPVLSAYGFLFILRIVMSWYPKIPVSKFPYVVAYAPTEPLLVLTRKLIPPLGGVDVTPVVWFGLVSFVNEILLGPQGLLVLLSRQTAAADRPPLKAVALASAQVPSSFLRCFPKGASRGRVLVVSSIATPNSVLSEEAFKGLGGRSFTKSPLEEDGLEEEEDRGFFDGEGEEDEEDYGLEAEAEGGGGDDELAVANLGLPQQLVDSLKKRGITHLFPIQRAVLVPAFEGRDLIARAKTGTGKTLAFGIPIIKKLTFDDEGKIIPRRGRLPRVLVLAPTRELAKQVEKEIKESAPHLNTVCVYGGVSYNLQQNAISRGVDVVVGTPGRIIDLINSNFLKLSEVQYLVLDEADQMLAVGFEEDVEVILDKLPQERQSMLFSATMPGWVKKLARKYLDKPLTIDLVGEQEEKLAEGIKLYAVYAKGGKTIVFTQTKRDADEVSLALTNSITSEALHGDISQHQRERTLNGFRQGKFTVLVATDVAARGLDIPNVDLIIHYELPNDPETFVHRSGRTGRAGKQGAAILMFTGSQRRTVKSLERDVGCRFEFISPPTVQQVLESSAEQVIATLHGVHQESIEFFLPSAEKLIQEQGTGVLAAALAHLSGFSQPPSSRSLISHEQGWVTLQLTREPGYSRGYLSARSVTGFLSDVYPDAADEVGKIHLIADERIQGAVFDLPEDIAKELLTKQMPPGNTLSKITKLPALQDDSPPSDNYGRFSNRERGAQRGSRERSFRGSSRGGWGGRSSDDDGSRRGGRSFRSDDSWSRNSRGGDDDWLISGRRSNRGSSFGSRERGGFGGACFRCGRTGHRASECPNKDDF